MPWSGHPLCGRPAGYLPPGTVGQWPPAPCSGGPSQGRRPENRPRGDDSDPGLASRRESDLGNCHATDRGTLEPAWAASTHSEGKGPENPSVVAPLAAAGCRGNRRRAVDRRLGKINLRPCLLRLWVGDWRLVGKGLHHTSFTGTIHTSSQHHCIFSFLLLVPFHLMFQCNTG